jgi:succinoglycan biosynthesis protein ExoO
MPIGVKRPPQASKKLIAMGRQYFISTTLARHTHRRLQHNIVSVYGGVMIQATVIIAAWNAETSLTESVESALAQTQTPIEIIVVDDCSTDSTYAMATALAAAHPQVRVLSQTRNGGPAAARNVALRAATGTWVAVLDADDLFCPGRLAALVDFGHHTAADIVCDGLVLRDQTRQTHGPAALAFDGDPEACGWTPEDYVRGNLHDTDGLSLGYLKPLFRRAFLEAHGLRYDERLRNGEDFHFVLEALAQGAVMRFQAEPGYVYSVAAGSVSHRLNPDHAAHLATADLDFVARHGVRLNADTVAMMRRRASNVLDFATAETALRALRCRDPITAGRALMQRPRAIGRFLRQLSDALYKRL